MPRCSRQAKSPPTQASGGISGNGFRTHCNVLHTWRIVCHAYVKYLSSKCLVKRELRMQ